MLETKDEKIQWLTASIEDSRLMMAGCKSRIYSTSIESEKSAMFKSFYFYKKKMMACQECLNNDLSNFDVIAHKYIWNPDIQLN